MDRFDHAADLVVALRRRQPRVGIALRERTEDIPELALTRGERGVIRSTWFAPFTRYEVEFACPTQCSNTRALLRAEQMEFDGKGLLVKG